MDEDLALLLLGVPTELPPEAYQELDKFLEDDTEWEDIEEKSDWLENPV